MAKTVIVNCSMPYGIEIKTYEMREGVLGIKTAFPDGRAVTLKAGINPGIDKEFFDFWLKQNAESELVKESILTWADEDEPEPTTEA